jgi:multiple sugar transport system substrate-binding protein
MEDDKVNVFKNQETQPEQPRPIFETTPVEEPQAPVPLTPEEVAPEVAAPTEVAAPPPVEPPPGIPPTFTENKNRIFLFIGAGVIFFILIFVLVMRVFLGGKKTITSQKVQITYWGLWEDKAVIDPLIAAYQAKNPNVTVDYKKMDHRDYRDKLLTQSKKGKGPDIFRFHNTWIPQIKEVLTPLPQSIMDGAEYEKTFYPIHVKDLKIEESYFGIPLTIDGLVLIYNDDLFKKAGISTAPRTWDDIVDYVEKLTVKDEQDRISTSGIALGTAANIEHFSDIFGLFLIQNGGNLKKLDQDVAASALEAYRAFAEPPNNVWDESMSNSINAFAKEQVAMIFAPSWEIIVIKAQNPDIKLKVVPIPVIPGTTSKPVSIASYWVEGVSRFSSAQEQIESWKFLEFLVDKENLTKLYENQSKTRLFGEPYSRRDLADLLVDNEYLGAVIKQGNNYVSQPLISRTYDNGLNDQISKYIEDAINATIEGSSYAQALETAKQGVDQVLARFEIK